MPPRASPPELSVLAKAVVDALEVVSRKANDRLANRVPGSTKYQVIGGINTMVGGVDPAQKIRAAVSAQTDAERKAAREPFISRVTVEDGSGKRHHYYFTRGTAPTAADPLDGRLAGYGSPIGRIAELKTGASHEVPILGEVVIIDRVELRPSRQGELWDGLNDRIETPVGRFSLESLRALLKTESTQAAQDLVDELLRQAAQEAAVQEGFRRQVIRNISLRDQPVLDEFQGEVFRLPLNRRILMGGPPGSGKTTTLIRRLAQKQNYEYLSKEEQSVIAEEQSAKLFDQRNWLMFCPTNLLKLYLKEAFNRESIAAPDRNIRTWTEHRSHLARDVLRILKSETGGRFILNESRKALVDESSPAQTKLYDAFEKYVEQQVAVRLTTSLETLERKSTETEQRTIRRLRERAGRGEITLEKALGLIDMQTEIGNEADRVKAETEASVQKIVGELIGRSADLLREVEDHLDDWVPDVAEEGDDEEDGIDDEGSERSSSRRVAAIKALAATVRATAQAAALSRHVRKGSRYSKLAEHLGAGLDPKRLVALGQRLLVRKHLALFARLHRVLLFDVAKLWQAYRRQPEVQSASFVSGALPTERRQISATELDIVLLATLRLGNRIIDFGGYRRLNTDTRLALLESLKGEYVTQILVDEATDFSAVQLACMKELAHPAFRSVFASGDVRQRVTTYGIQSVDELQWVAPDFEYREVKVAYRQTPKLRELAKELAALTVGPQVAIEAPQREDEPLIAPLLLENALPDQEAEWLTNRIREIERAVGYLPSIAVFVDGDEQVAPVVERLKPRLIESNIRVVGCPEGRVVGTESEVRVFDVKHIKGLEFEAVFFLAVDELAAHQPFVFDKFLYVGVTRAAAYLALTCRGALPAPLEVIRKLFSTTKWQHN